MTNLGGVGFAIVYEFHSGETMLVRISELLGPMKAVVEYMASKNGGVKRIIEPPRPLTAAERFANIKDRMALMNAARRLEREARVRRDQDNPSEAA